MLRSAAIRISIFKVDIHWSGFDFQLSYWRSNDDDDDDDDCDDDDGDDYDGDDDDDDDDDGDDDDDVNDDDNGAGVITWDSLCAA